MKPTQTILIFVLLMSASINAQNKSKKTTGPAATSEKCYNADSKIINAGVGLFHNRYYKFTKNGAYFYKSSPSINLSYEQACKKKVGPGYLGLGAYFAYQTAYYRYDDYYYNGNQYYYRHNWTYTFLAFRAAYHADDLMNDKAELYFGLAAGLRIQKYTFETNSTDPNRNNYELQDGSIYPGYSLFVGGRVYLTKNIGLFAECGYGMSYLTGGLSFKF